MKDPKRVTVIGAGIAGLACAYEILSQARNKGLPIEVAVVDRASYIGGKIKTTYADPYTVEGGPDCFILEKPWALSLIRELGMEDQLVNTSSSASGTYIYAGNRLHRLPDGLIMMIPTKIIPFATSPLISWPGKIRMGMDLLIPRRQGGGDESLASFVTRRLGREALEKIAEPLVGGIHAGNPDNMSLLATFPRFIEMEQQSGSLIRGMFARKKAMAEAMKNRPKTGAPPRTFFISMKKGMAQLTDALADVIGRQRITTNLAIRTVAKGDQEGYLLETADGQQWQADSVVMASESFATADMVASLAPDLAATLKKIPYVSSSIVSLVFSRDDIPHPLDTYGFIVPKISNRKIMATTWSSIKWPHRSPAGKVLMRSFVGGAQQPELADLDDATITATVLHELKEIIGISAKPEQVWINRWPQGMPQYIVGHLDRLAVIDQQLKALPGLYLTGAGYRGIGLPDCINHARQTGEKVVADLL
ncbi:MAG: protoporphyrinogen oxidase [Deltaproteobacteria bacterium]|nr:protoporphyrinogen oxidase [Candidatus Anaeroferrophillus wilburensis]MBN2890070.1 protoporphyrinogen oxidase [Deltaproteobacteria bacterium]